MAKREGAVMIDHAIEIILQIKIVFMRSLFRGHKSAEV